MAGGGRLRLGYTTPGGFFSRTTISVAVIGISLPVRMKMGTPAQRHDSTFSLRATKVSVVESGATPLTFR